MAPKITDQPTLGKVAKIAGGFYVAYILASVLADLVAHIGRGDVQQIHQAIVADASSFRLALVIAFVSAFLFVMAAWGLYVLLRRVDESLALLFLLLNAVGVALQCSSMFPLISALLQADDASHLQAYSAAQLEGLVNLSINVYKTGFVTAQLFFGTWLFPLGYLVFRSRFLPKALGVLLILDGVAVMVWFMQALLLPAYPAIHYPGLVVSLLAEVGLALWLLFKGLKVSDPAPAGPGLRNADPRADVTSL